MGASEDLPEAEIIFNRASLALATSQRLIASWLPPRTPQEVAAERTQHDLEEKESEDFSPLPESYDQEETVRVCYDY